MKKAIVLCTLALAAPLAFAQAAKGVPRLAIPSPFVEFPRVHGQFHAPHGQVMTPHGQVTRAPAHSRTPPGQAMTPPGQVVSEGSVVPFSNSIPAGLSKKSESTPICK